MVATTSLFPPGTISSHCHIAIGRVSAVYHSPNDEYTGMIPLKNYHSRRQDPLI